MTIARKTALHRQIPSYCEFATDKVLRVLSVRIADVFLTVLSFESYDQAVGSG
jgi:hypothetical protein